MINKLSLMFAILIYSLQIFAVNNSETGAAINAPTRTPEVVVAPQLPSANSGTGVAAPEIKPVEYKTSLDNASSGQNSYAALGGVVSGAFAVKAYQCWSTNKHGANTPMCLALSAASVGAAAVALHNTKQANQNKAYSDQFASGNSATPTVDNSATASTDGREISGPGSTTISGSVLAKLKRLPVKIDLQKGTFTKDGKTYSPNDFSSPAAMAAAGMSPADFGKIKDEIKKIEKTALGKAADASENTDLISGSKKSNSGSGAADASGYGFQAPTNSAALIARDPAAQVAGLAKNYNGEQIGVAADSLFGIIDRRYDLHKNKGSFILPNQ